MQRFGKTLVVVAATLGLLGSVAAPAAATPPATPPAPPPATPPAEGVVVGATVQIPVTSDVPIRVCNNDVARLGLISVGVSVKSGDCFQG